jgi:hypothetical protein
VITVNADAETISIDPTQTTIMNLESLAFAWGYRVSFGPAREVDTYEAEVDVTGRDAYDFTVRFTEEIG